MSSCVLLGRDILKLFQLRLTSADVNEPIDTISTIMNIDYGCSNTNLLDVCRMNEQLPAEVKAELVQIFNDHYVDQTRPDESEVKAKLKKLNLKLNDPKPFHFLPR